MEHVCELVLQQHTGMEQECEELMTWWCKWLRRSAVASCCEDNRAICCCRLSHMSLLCRNHWLHLPSICCMSTLCVYAPCISNVCVTHTYVILCSMCSNYCGPSIRILLQDWLHDHHLHAKKHRWSCWARGLGGLEGWGRAGQGTNDISTAEDCTTTVTDAITLCKTRSNAAYTC